MFSKVSILLFLSGYYYLEITTAAWQPSIVPTRSAFGQQQSTTTRAISRLFATAPSEDDDHHPISYPSFLNRRDLLWKSLAIGASAVVSTTSQPAHALVKGNAPPPPKKSGGGDKPKCVNVEECQAQAELREQQEREAALANAIPIEKTAKGTRYRDFELGDSDSAAAAMGDQVTLYYKVLKLGKRSYDGISGEGTVVFSRGYGLEDDEQKPGDKAFVTTLGAYSNIAALNDAVVGMKVGGTRRFAVQPEAGWRKPGKACDGGPGGQGAGGELRTDYVVVPTAQLIEQEACFDQSKQPFPLTYAQQRRMAQRFDQSLIMEVELVKIEPGDSSLL